MRSVIETDDINSVLKSPSVKSRKKQKKRKRSSWASGVIKKTRRKTDETTKDEHNEEEEVKPYISINDVCEKENKLIKVKSELVGDEDSRSQVFIQTEQFSFVK